MQDKTLTRFRKTAFWESVSFIVLLFIAMPIKYGLGNPLPVKYIGMAHGILFILYVLFLIHVVMEHGWPFNKWVLALIASIVPFGPFLFDRRLKRELAGEELVDATIKE